MKTQQVKYLLILNLNYADDICLLENAIKQAQEQLDSLKDNARKVGLEINIKKTEYMTNINTQESLNIDGTNIERVEDFKYLGARMKSTDKDVETRIALAWSAFWSLKKIWKSQHLTEYIKINLFNASCVSILLYGSETWLINDRMKMKINDFANNLRK